MAESRALSQSEIDALLNQIPGGEPEADGPSPEEAEEPSVSIGRRDHGFARIIKTYDFRRPDKFSKEQWQTLQVMHDSYARLVGAAFSSRLRTLVAVRLSSIDQGLYEEWQSQVPSKTVCYVFSLPPLAGNIVVEFSLDIATEVIDRLLGGNGLLLDRTRELGEIETLLLRSFGGAVSSSLQEMWDNVVQVDPQLNDIGYDASLIQVAGPNDVVITAFFEVNLGDRLGAMSICTPYTLVEPLASKLSAQVWRSKGGSTARDPRYRAVMEALIQDAPLEIAVELGSADVPMRELAALQEGDTLVLDSRLNHALPVLVAGRERFLCRPGAIGKRVGVTVTDIVDRPSALEFEHNGELQLLGALGVAGLDIDGQDQPSQQGPEQGEAAPAAGLTPAEQPGGTAAAALASIAEQAVPAASSAIPGINLEEPSNG